MKALPYLGFDGLCAEAFRFYHEMLGGELDIMTHGESPMAERIFAALAEGGSVEMPIGKTFWAERFGMATDRFGTPWMVNCAPEA